MKIISYNVNGLRAAIKKDLTQLLIDTQPDIICFQEIKALEIDIDATIFTNLGYKGYFFSAEKKGYSGVAIFTKIEPKSIDYGMGDSFFDAEGRTIVAHFDTFSVVNTYFPSGTTGDARQQIKYQFLELYETFITNLRKKNPNIVVTGDYNIAHREIDLHNPKSNQKTSGFLPEERAWMTRWFESGMVDSYRHIHGDKEGAYTWWTARFPSVRLENKGWRIDYISVSEPLTNQLIAADIYPTYKQSDHCALSITLSEV